MHRANARSLHRCHARCAGGIAGARRVRGRTPEPKFIDIEAFARDEVVAVDEAGQFGLAFDGGDEGELEQFVAHLGGAVHR